MSHIARNCLFGSVFVLAALAGPLTPACASTGQQHNQGVAFVLDHMKAVPPKSELDADVVKLTLKFCRKSGLDCGRPVLPEFPLQAPLLIGSIEGSAQFKIECRALVSTVRAAKDVPSLEVSLAALEQQAATVLDAREKKRFSDAVSIASASARLWAPVALGGRGGGKIIIPPGGKPPSDIDWREVAVADAIGCAIFFEIGCIPGAVALSVADIVHQLLF